MKPNAALVVSDRPGGPRAFLWGLLVRLSASLHPSPLGGGNKRGGPPTNHTPTPPSKGRGRKAATVCIALAAFGLPALAGDRALIDYVGFSADSRYFAFEEFGIQDGSGFAYANLYVVDLMDDRWVADTPIRQRSEDEDISLAEIRAEARAEAASHIDAFGIDVPVEIAALIGDGAPDNDGKSLDFGAPGYGPGEVIGLHNLTLSTFPTTAASPCGEWFDREPLGFALTLDGAGGEREIHRDHALPRSRGCPFDYRLYGVVMPFGGATLDNAVAIISVYPGGFEGPDRRFVVVPIAR